MNGWELLNAIAAEHEGTDAEAARELMKRAGVKASAVEILLPIIEHAIAHSRRETVRGRESAAFGRGSTRRELGEVIDSVDHRKALLDESFALGDGRFVLWGEATVEDHRSRIELLATMRDGISATMKRHEDAIALIESHGVSSLGEIESAA